MVHGLDLDTSSDLLAMYSEGLGGSASLHPIFPDG